MKIQELSRAFIFIGVLLVFPFFVLAASISMSPSTGTFLVGDLIDLNIQLNTEGADVDGADVNFLNYNPSLLEPQDQDSLQDGIQILPGNLMPLSIINSVDSAAGKIRFSQITSGGTKFSGSGTLAKLKFKVLSAGAANITFNFTSGNTTDTNVASAGADLLSSVTNGSYTLQGIGPVPSPSGIFNQYKQDGSTLILEGASVTDTTLVFKGDLSDPSGLKVKMDLELRQEGESFTGVPTIVSPLLDSGQTVSITRGGLSPASYHWKARAVNSDDKAGPWVEFGSIGNTDFIISQPSVSENAGGGGGGGGTNYNYGSSGGGGSYSNSSGGGILYPSTGESLSISSITVPQACPAGYIFSPQSTASSSLSALSIIFNRELEIGMRGDDVRKLQEFLAKDKAVYSEGKVTGFFGILTKSAVFRFQKKYGIKTVGRVGPATKQKLNELLGKKSSVSQELCIPVSSNKNSLEIQRLQLQLKLLQEQLKLLQKK